MSYNDFYQRLLSTGSNRPQFETTHLVGQSLSPHRYADPGPPTVVRPGTNASLIPDPAKDPVTRPHTGPPPGTAMSLHRVGPNVIPYAVQPPGTAAGMSPGMAGRVWSVQQEFNEPKKSVGFVPAYPMEDGKTEEPGDPVCRAGRLGAPWRHVRQCTGNEGNHICFIDGTVKMNDMSAYPPYGYVSPRPAMFDPSSSSRYMSAPLSRSMPAAPAKYNNSFNNHAKSGFRYWFEEKKALPAGAKQTIGGRLMKMGVGY